jgi:hypothetical protein
MKSWKAGMGIIGGFFLFGIGLGFLLSVYFGLAYGMLAGIFMGLGIGVVVQQFYIFMAKGTADQKDRGGR